MPINYCSLIYKHRLQKKGYRERFRPFVAKTYEGSTESGFIRRLSIQDTATKTKELVRLFREKNCPDTLWFLDNDKRQVFFHDSLLRYVDFTRYDLTISYFMPHMVADCETDDGAGKKIALNANRNVYVMRDCVYQTTIKNSVTIKGFQRLFIERKNALDVLKGFYRTYSLGTKADIDRMMSDRDRLDYLGGWELIGTGLHELY